MFIEYVATESIAPYDYLKPGVDISFTVGDSSINSTTTVLSAIPVGYWINISGSPLNSIWVQTVTVTANKITVAQAVATESAGALITLTGYEHGLGETYSLEIGATSVSMPDKNSRVVNSGMDVSESREVIDWGEEDYFAVMSQQIALTDKKYWDEFRSSVRGGAYFTFDPYGTQASPVDQFTAEIESGVRYAHVAQTLAIKASFTVRRI